MLQGYTVNYDFIDLCFGLKCSAFNKNAKSEVIPVVNDMDPIEWTDVSHNPDFFCCEEAVHIPPEAPYDLFWPVNRGQLNIMEKSAIACVGDIADILEYLITKHLKIPKSKFKSRKVVYIIPDLHDRKHTREMVNMLLKDLGFAACMLQHTAVCACVGSGLSSACVIDLGDSKTSVCCVDDGVVIPHSRIHLPYGGDDIGRILCWLLDTIDFNCKEFDFENQIHKSAMRQMKEQLCHMLLEDVAVQTYDLYVRRYEKPTLMHPIKMHDEVFRAPLALFFPSVFGLKMTDGFWFPDIDYSDPSDLYEDILMSEVEPVSALTLHLKEKARLAEENREKDALKKQKLEEMEGQEENEGKEKDVAVKKDTKKEDFEQAEDQAEGDSKQEESFKKGVICQWDNCTFVSGSQSMADHILKAHIGTGKKDYVCKWANCSRMGRLFGLRSHIVTHMKTHIGEKLSKCLFVYFFDACLSANILMYR